MTEDPEAGYRELQERRPELFASDPAGIRLVTDGAEMAAIADTVGARLAAKGMPAAWARPGLFYRDPYIAVLRDAVVFPDGQPGIHHRVIHEGVPDDVCGVAVLPLLDDRAILIRHYRHAVGGWCWEIPRGGVTLGVTAMDAARSELIEEIGAETHDMVMLGSLHGSTALIRGRVALLLARIDTVGRPALGEGIVEIRSFTAAAIDAMMAADEIRDGFTVAALAHARLRGLW